MSRTSYAHIRYYLVGLLFSCGLLFTSAQAEDHAVLSESSSSTPAHTVPYLQPNSPTFDLNMTQFRAQFNAHNPHIALNEFHTIIGKEDHSPLIRAATKINEHLYASTAIERSSGKIKTLQLTYLPVKGDDEKSTYTLTLRYVAALMCEFDSTLTRDQSLEKATRLLDQGKGHLFFTRTNGAVRYIVVDNGENGLTFAIEPIKLTLS